MDPFLEFLKRLLTSLSSSVRAVAVIEADSQASAACDETLF